MGKSTVDPETGVTLLVFTRDVDLKRVNMDLADILASRRDRHSIK